VQSTVSSTFSTIVRFGPLSVWVDPPLPVTVQVMLMKSKPGVAASVKWYVPARTLVKSCSPLSDRVNGDGTVGVDFPSTSCVKLNVPVAPSGSVCLRILIVPQLEMLIGIGATKSFSSEPNELPEERLFSQMSPKCLHTLGGKIPAAVKLMPASPNVELIPFFVFPDNVLGLPGGLLSVTSALFTDDSAETADSGVPLSQQGTELLASHRLGLLGASIQRCTAKTGTPLPPKSKSINRSPTVRFNVTGPGVVPMPTWFWFSSKSMCAEPSRLLRSHATYRKSLAAFSWLT